MIGSKFDKPLPAVDEEAYSQAAQWCNETQLGVIVDTGDCYEIVKRPPPAPPTLEQQIAEIHARLTEIDLESVRPLRAIAAGEATESDHDKLTALASEASALREQLATLTAQAS